MEKISVITCLLLLLSSLLSGRRFLQALSPIPLIAVLSLRTLKAGYPPLFDPFDSILLFLLTFLVASLLVRVNVRVSSALSLALAIPLLFVRSSFHLLPPIIRTPLFIVHVSTAMLGYALFVSASIVSIINLLSDQRSDVRKVALWGLVLFSVSLTVGGIWAFLAWADLFPFEPKSLFSLLTWVYFALTVHFRFDGKLKRWEDAAFVLGGFLVLFTFLGVNYLLRGTHAF